MTFNTLREREQDFDSLQVLEVSESNNLATSFDITDLRSNGHVIPSRL